MPKVAFTLEQQLADQRSNETAYVVRIENQGAAPIQLLSLTPRVPDEVQVVEAKSPSLLEAKTRHTTLCRELTALVEYHLLSSSQEVRMRFQEVLLDALKQLTSSSGLLSIYMRLFSRRAADTVDRVLRRGDILAIEIRSTADALDVFQRFFAPAPEASSLRQVYEAKLEQLRATESKLGAEPEAASLATIEPDSVFAITYVFRFPRSRVDPRKYNIVLEAAYSESGQPQRFVRAAAASLIVSPSPWLLTSIAIVASVLGVVLRDSVKIAARPPSEALQAFGFLGMATVPRALAAAILALVFFNVYEYTSLGKQSELPVGWRSALVIGCLCGLGDDRVLAALEAFLK